MQNNLTWKTPLEERGVLTGVDRVQEWMLPLWFKAYTKHNTLPITFIDFGMSKSAKIWCQTKGRVHSLPFDMSFIKTKASLCPITSKFWERVYPGNVWQARGAWFKKPFALMQTPYHLSLWLDVDCQVKTSVESILSLLEQGHDSALCRASASYERSSRAVGLAHKGEKVFNSGVLAFKHGSNLISTWAQEARDNNEHFLGDENILGHTIFTHNFLVYELDLSYNLPFFMQDEREGEIIHYLSKRGKSALLKMN